MSDLHALLAERQIKTAVVIDDAFDEIPRATDLSEGVWSVFFDDMTDEDEKIFEKLYPGYKEADRADLRVSNAFVRFLWKERSSLPKRASDIFKEYDRDNAQERKNLEGLVERLRAIGLDCTPMGRDLDETKAKAADLVLIDLFLGFAQLEMDVSSAIDIVREKLLRGREDSPPLIVLMSNSPRLQEKRNDFRDDAGLLGSTFRVMTKADLRKTDGLESVVLRLADRYEDAKRLARFIHAWATELELAKKRFIKHIRRLDLTDLSQIRALLLDAEGEPLGSYVLDVCDAALEYEVEGNAETINAARNLNAIDLEKYVPPHLLGTSDLQELVFRMVFHHPGREKITHDALPAGVRFGDVLRWRNADGSDTSVVSLVITAACDLARTGGPNVFLLQGSLQPLRPDNWSYAQRPTRTPIIILENGERMWIMWDMKNVRSLAPAEMVAKLAEANGPYRIGCLRDMYAVEIQQKFVSDFGRIGQVANPPATFPVSVTAFYPAADGTLRRLNVDGLASASCYVGRDDKANPVYHLVLGEQACDSMQQQVAALTESDVYHQCRTSLGALKQDVRFFASALIVMGDSKKSKQTKADNGTVYATVVRNVHLTEGSPVSGDQRNGLLVLSVSDDLGDNAPARSS